MRVLLTMFEKNQVGDVKEVISNGNKNTEHNNSNSKRPICPRTLMCVSGSPVRREKFSSDKGSLNKSTSIRLVSNYLTSLNKTTT